MQYRASRVGEANGAEEFALAVLRRAAVELDAYANTEKAVDEIEGLLEWVKSRAVSTDR